VAERSRDRCSHTCAGDGSYRLQIAVLGTPKTVGYTATSNGTVVAQGTLSLTFESVYPNGPSCDPACLWPPPIDPASARAPPYHRSVTRLAPTRRQELFPDS
jgi:hypothetical protein